MRTTFGYEVIDQKFLKFATTEELQVLAGQETLRTYVQKAYPGFQWHRNAVVLGKRLEQVVSGELKRLMVFMPPRSVQPACQPMERSLQSHRACA